MAVPIQVNQDTPTLSPGAPVNGRFLINVTADDAVASPITIVQNWTAALKK